MAKKKATQAEVQAQPLTLTAEQIAATALSVNEQGFALVHTDADGNKQAVRQIHTNELLSMLAMMYGKHLTDHPDDPIMILPMSDKGDALAVSYIKIAPTAKPDAEKAAPHTPKADKSAKAADKPKRKTNPHE